MSNENLCHNPLQSDCLSSRNRIFHLKFQDRATDTRDNRKRLSIPAPGKEACIKAHGGDFMIHPITNQERFGSLPVVCCGRCDLKTPQTAVEDTHFVVAQASDHIVCLALRDAKGDPAGSKAIEAGVTNGIQEAPKAREATLPHPPTTSDAVTNKLDAWPRTANHGQAEQPTG